MHALQLDPVTGNLIISDEGEHCFYEGVFIVTPSHQEAIQGCLA